MTGLSSSTSLNIVSGTNSITFLIQPTHVITVACFAGGNFLLGGLALGEQKYIDFGLKLVDGCYDTYSGDATGIGPKVFDWLPEACNAAGVCGGYQKRDDAAEAVHRIVNDTLSSVTGISVSSSLPLQHETDQPIADILERDDSKSSATVTACSPTPTTEPPYSNCSIPPTYVSQTTFYDKSGFWITDATYDLRPEVLESLYYAYRVTGNTTYQDWSWAAFQAINATTRVGSGYSQINNVNVAGGDGFTNVQESFLFAEVMKYAYLIQAADGPWQVNYQGQNQFVFNTEAHPLKVKGSPLP